MKISANLGLSKFAEIFVFYVLLFYQLFQLCSALV